MAAAFSKYVQETIVLFIKQAMRELTEQNIMNVLSNRIGLVHKQWGGSRVWQPLQTLQTTHVPGYYVHGWLASSSI